MGLAAWIRMWFLCRPRRPRHSLAALQNDVLCCDGRYQLNGSLLFEGAEHGHGNHPVIPSDIGLDVDLEINTKSVALAVVVAVPSVDTMGALRITNSINR